MKFLRANKEEMIFHLGKREQKLLFDTIKLYPLIPAAHHRLSRNNPGPKGDENQRLLEEALAEQRQENRKQVLAMLKDPARFRETKSGLELTLSPAQIEWLLQVLNDVRVGSWLALGEPEPGEIPAITVENARHMFVLEVCGLFESTLLSAFGISESPDWGAE